MAGGKRVDPGVEAFVCETIDSFATWDVVIFFHDWPGFAGDVAAVARHIGRNADEVARPLEKLAQQEILRCTHTEGHDVYSYAPDAATTEQIERFAQVIEQREARLALLAGLLRRGIR